MEIQTQSVRNITPEVLAKALADALPEEFAAFWFEFNEQCTKKKLDAFAEIMSDHLGSNRKKPLHELCRLMDFYTVQHEKKIQEMVK